MKLTPKGSAAIAGLVALGAVAAGVYAQSASGNGKASQLVRGATHPLELRPVSNAPAIPELGKATAWDNTTPLTTADLKGKVVLVDFWDASCINCRRTFPFLRKLYATYKDKGLVVVGVHTPEFDFEKSHGYVARVTKELDVTWPVAEDPERAIWDSFSNQYWPAQYLVDRDGRFRAGHIGEGDDDAIEEAVRTLLGEGGQAGAATTGSISDTTTGPAASLTPELYLGSDRQSNNPDVLSYTGHFTVKPEMRSPDVGATLALKFTAKEVYAVLAPGTSPVARFTVLLDGAPVPPDRRGADVMLLPDGSTELKVANQDLFHILTGPSVTSGRLTLTAVTPGAEMFTFTFGS